MQQRYLDYNATCPVHADALKAYHEASLQSPGNPSSLHWAGRAARKVLDDARDSIAQYLNAEAGSVVFTSGGTEANNMAIFGYLAHQMPGRVVVSAIEHPAVLQPLESWCQRDGWELVMVRPNADGYVSAKDFIAQLNEQTRMAAIMMANNETGVIQPVADIVAACREQGVAILVDAVQGLGKLPLDLTVLGADFTSLSAHKVGGPRGVGALVVRRGVRMQAFMQGGGQERKRRSGTENVPAIAGFAAALGKIDYAALAVMRDDFELQLQQALPDVVIYGADAARVANTSMFSMPGLDGETLLMQLDLAGFAVASGSACSSGKREPSHVLLAMGVSEQKARSSLRVSFGPENTQEDATALVKELVTIRQRLKMMSGR